MRGATILFSLLLVAAPARAAELRLVCGEPHADANGSAHIMAGVVDTTGFVQARTARVLKGGRALAAVDALGRVDVSGFADGAEVALEVTTARGTLRGRCRDSADPRSLAFVDIPASARAGGGPVRLGLTGPLAPVAVLRCNSGEVSSRPASSGLQVTYTPAPAKTPDLAIVEATADLDGRLFRARAVIPLVASVKLPGTSEPRSDVTMEVAGQLFGPVRADGRGRFEVRIELPPGVTSGRGESIDAIGNRGAQEIAIPVPPVHRVGLLEVTPGKWRGQPLVARIFMATSRGEPGRGERVLFGMAGGEVEPAVEVEPGVYQAVLAPPPGDTKAAARVVALVDDSPVAEITVPRVARPPVEIALQLPPDQRWALRGGAGERLVAEVEARDALGMPVEAVNFSATVDDEPAVVRGEGTRLHVLAGPPQPAVTERLVVARAVERKPPCQADHLRIVAAPRAEARAVDASGLACPLSRIAVDSEQTYGALPLRLPAAAAVHRARVEAAGSPARSVVLLRSGDGALPLALDVDAGVAAELRGELALPVAPAPVEVRAERTAAGDIEVVTIDAIGEVAAGRSIAVWPQGACRRLESLADGRWRCVGPQAETLVFTEPASGASVLVPRLRAPRTPR